MTGQTLGKSRAVGILGGTFNPVHNGHLRLAVEAGEVLGLDKVCLTPCATPPHKPPAGLLPYELRLALTRAAVSGRSRLDVSDLEGRLPGPSYTARLLPAWRAQYQTLPFFFVGVEDFAQMPKWRQGLDLPQLGRMVIAARGNAGRELFFSVLARHWPHHRRLSASEAWAEAALGGQPPPDLGAAFIPPNGLCLFLPVPRLDISASHIRALWLAGRDPGGLLPEAVLVLLRQRQDEVRAIWQQEEEADRSANAAGLA